MLQNILQSMSLLMDFQTVGSVGNGLGEGEIGVRETAGSHHLPEPLHFFNLVPGSHKLGPCP